MTTWIAMTNLATEIADSYCRSLVYTERRVPHRAHAYLWTDAELAARLEADANIKPTGKMIADFRRMLANSIVDWYEEHGEEMIDLASEHLEVVPSSDGLYFYDSNRGRWNRIEALDLIRFGEMLSVEPRNAYVCWRATTWTLEMRDGFRPQP